MARSSPTSSRALAPRLPASLQDGVDATLDDDEEWNELALRGDWSGQEADDAEIVACTFTGARLTGVRLHGSKLDLVKGAMSLKGAVIGSEQIYPLSLRLFDALKIVIDDEPEPHDEH